MKPATWLNRTHRQTSSWTVAAAKNSRFDLVRLGPRKHLAFSDRLPFRDATDLFEENEDSSRSYPVASARRRSARRQGDVRVSFRKILIVVVIVIGSHGRHGLERALLGSVAEGVMRHAPCSVLVVRTPE